MFQYLPHRRRLWDEPYQVHPPAAPAALQRKHPVDARQQLRPHIVRVRRQYPKVALPMLARRRYQRRYPIQKFAGAQP